MITFVARRMVLAALTLFVIITISFFMQRIAPGGPFDEERAVAPEIRKQQEREWRLDRPLLAQYGLYLKDVIALPPDLKRSMKRPDYTVWELVGSRLQVSLSLGIVVMIYSLMVGLPLGILAALKKNSAVDYLVMAIALIGLSLPNFVIGPCLKWVFALKLGWFPESRWVSPLSMVLPVLALSPIYIAIVARLVRSGMLDVLGQDYIRTARAKGLPERIVVMKHAMRGATLPVVAWLGPAFASLAVGSVVIERVFNIPGLGNTFVEAAFNRDYTLVMGTVIVYSSLLILLNLIADLGLALLDPRVRLEA